MDVEALVEGVRRYTIHGEPYAVVYFSRDGDRETIHQAQLSEDALPVGLRAGDQVILTYIGTIVVSIRRASTA